MAILRMGFHSVMKRFPAYEDTIMRCHREDETFKSMCRDFTKCCEALRRWTKSASEESPARREEYEALMQDLEMEILQYLQKHTQKGARSS